MMRFFFDVVHELRRIVSVLWTFNKNFIEYKQMVEEDIERNKFEPIDPKSLKPRFDLGTEVVVNNEISIWDGWRGKIVSMGDMLAKVRLTNETELWCGGSEMIPLDEKPAAYEAQSRLKNSIMLPHEEELHQDGHLYPSEWRHNLGMDVFDPEQKGHEEHEKQLMTEEAFRIYNAGLYTAKVVENKQKEQ